MKLYISNKTIEAIINNYHQENTPAFNIFTYPAH